MSQRVRCPVCGEPGLDATVHDAAGMCTCSCGHRAYAGYVAELAASQGRSNWLADRIREGRPPAPEVIGPYAIWPVPQSPQAQPPQGAAGEAAGARSPVGVGPGGRRAGAGVQSLLLALGALMLIVAATIFAAVVWDRIGALGQVVTMTLLTAGVAGLAVRLSGRLHGTAEALAVVAAGLLVVDALAAPLLGLLPRAWLEVPSVYPAAVAAALAAVLVAAARRWQLRAWEWIGWAAAPTAGYLLAFGAVDAGAHPALSAALVAVPVATSLAIVAWARLRPAVREPVAMGLAGGAGLAMGALLTASAAMTRDALPGALVTTVLAAVGLGVWARVDRAGWVRLAAAALVGTAGAALLLLAVDPPLWLSVLVAVVGLGAGWLAAWLDRRGRTPESLTVGGLGLASALHPAVLPATAACGLWLTWSAGRYALAAEAMDFPEARQQVALLAGIVAVVGFAAAAYLPSAPWVAALLGEFALLTGAPGRVDLLEAATLPFASLLLLAGLLWRRHAPDSGERSSLVWLGPAATVALVPSALAAWAAPWVLAAPDQSSTTALIRLGLVLVASLAGVVVGARWSLAGLLLPASAALVVVTLAQTWSGLSALPRWVAFGLAGTLLVVLGARVEWLRGQGGRARTWLRQLR